MLLPRPCRRSPGQGCRMLALSQVIRVQRRPYGRAGLGMARKAPIRRTISGRRGPAGAGEPQSRYAQAGHRSSHLPPASQLRWALVPELPALAVRRGSVACVPGAESPRAGCRSRITPSLCRRDRQRASSRRYEERQGASGAARIEPGCPKHDRSVAPDAGGGSAEQERPPVSRRWAPRSSFRGDVPSAVARQDRAIGSAQRKDWPCVRGLSVLVVAALDAHGERARGWAPDGVTGRTGGGPDGSAEARASEHRGSQNQGL